MAPDKFNDIRGVVLLRCFGVSSMHSVLSEVILSLFIAIHVAMAFNFSSEKVSFYMNVAFVVEVHWHPKLTIISIKMMTNVITDDDVSQGSHVAGE